MCNKWLYVATNFADENQSGLLPKTNNSKNISPYDWHYLMVGSDNLFRMQRMSGTHLSPGRNKHNRLRNLRTVSSHQKQVSQKLLKNTSHTINQVFVKKRGLPASFAVYCMTFNNKSDIYDRIFSNLLYLCQIQALKSEQA